MELRNATFAPADLPEKLNDCPDTLRYAIIAAAKAIGMTPPKFYRNWRTEQLYRAASRRRAIAQVRAAA